MTVVPAIERDRQRAIGTTLLWPALVGASLWFPGVAIVNLPGFGLQLSHLALFGLLTTTYGGLSRLSVAQVGLIVIAGAAPATGLLIGSEVFAERLKSSIVDILGVAIGVILVLGGSRTGHWASFWKGFVWCGFGNAAVAVIQTIGFRLGTGAVYFPVNNASFSLVDRGSARFHQRALNLCPEPSILASLFLCLLLAALVQLLVRPRRSIYMVAASACLGLLATGSQSIVVAPLALAGAWVLARRIRRRSLLLPRDIGLVVAVLVGVTGAVALFPSVLTSIGRFGDSDVTTSFGSRTADLELSFQAFLDRPLLGYGEGSVSSVLTSRRSSVGLDENASAASGVTRVLVENGLIGASALAIVFGSVLLGSARIRSEANAVSGAVALGLALSFALFVGYRSLVHPWLVLAIALELFALRDSVDPGFDLQTTPRIQRRTVCA